MASVFKACNGQVFSFSSGGSKSPGVGFYRMSPTIRSSGKGLCLITGLPLNYSELFQPNVTLDDKRIIYSFGSAWASGQLSLLLALGPSSGQAEMLGKVVDWYAANRISKKKAPIQVSAGGKAREMFVTGLQMGNSDPEYNIQNVAIDVLLSLT